MNERLKKVRKSLKLTQGEFGEKVGIKQSTVGLIEQGVRKLTDRTLLSICKTYNVNETWLREGGDDEAMFCAISDASMVGFAEEHGLDKTSQSFLLAFAKMPEKKRTNFLSTLKELLEEVDQDGMSEIPLYEAEEEPQEEPKGYHWEDFDVDEETEKYRQELLREKRAREKSSAFQERKKA